MKPRSTAKDSDVGWPWMKNVPKAALEPKLKSALSKQDDADPRPWVEDLVAEYRQEIRQVQRALKNDDIIRLFDKNKHDDLWTLRFLLSHKGDVPRAIEAARTCLVFRKSYNLDAQDIRAISPQVRFLDQANTIYMTKFVQPKGTTAVGKDALTMVLPDPDHCGVLFYLNLASIDTQMLADVSQQDWFSAMAYIDEYQFQWNDYLTRTTGRLTKAVHLIDVKGVTLQGLYNRTTQDKYTAATQTLEDCYPQAVQHYFVLHAPLWVEGVWRMLKPLLPTRVVEKLDFLNPSDYPEDKERILQFTPDKLLPKRLGGQYEHWPLVF